MRLGDDLKDARWIYLKGWLFLAMCVIASATLLIQNPTLVTLFLVVIALWSAARFYYFMFYVIDRYVDPSFRFAGLGSFLRYLWSKRSERRT